MSQIPRNSWDLRRMSDISPLLASASPFGTNPIEGASNASDVLFSHMSNKFL